MNVILASASPRRHELLAYLISDFSILPADVDESVRVGETPANYVTRLALEKAVKIASANRQCLVIGADTTVVLNDEIIGKPADASEAASMLRKLRAQVHTVYTGIALVNVSANIQVAECSASQVEFDNYSDADIENYIRTGEPMDKAGAYAFQGVGSKLIKSVQGSPSNIIGLDLVLLKNLLERNKLI